MNTTVYPISTNPILSSDSQNGVHLVLEIKGFEPDQVHAKHAAAKRWVSAVNNWGKLKKWDFLVCRDPQLLGQELDQLVASES